MGWENLNESGQSKQAIEGQKQKQQDLAQLFHRVFSTEDGHKLLEHLTNHYVIHNETPINSVNIEYEAGYHAGEAGVVKAIIHQMQRAEEL